MPDTMVSLAWPKAVLAAIATTSENIQSTRENFLLNMIQSFSGGYHRPTNRESSGNQTTPHQGFRLSGISVRRQTDADVYAQVNPARRHVGLENIIDRELYLEAVSIDKRELP